MYLWVFYTLVAHQQYSQTHTQESDLHTANLGKCASIVFLSLLFYLLSFFALFLALIFLFNHTITILLSPSHSQALFLSSLCLPRFLPSLPRSSLTPPRCLRVSQGVLFLSLSSRASSLHEWLCVTCCNLAYFESSSSALLQRHQQSHSQTERGGGLVN